VVSGPEELKPRVVLFTGVAGTGKSTHADVIGRDLAAPVFSFDWVMGALTPFEGVQAAIQPDREVFRGVGYSLLSSLVEKQLRNGQNAVLDCVTRAPLLERWHRLAARYDAGFDVIECVCSDEAIHRSRIVGRRRGIPGWAELTWEHVAEARRTYEPVDCEKLVVDAVEPVDANLARVRRYLRLSKDQQHE
jgi:predicted kinase